MIDKKILTFAIVKHIKNIPTAQFAVRMFFRFSINSQYHRDYKISFPYDIYFSSGQ